MKSRGKRFQKILAWMLLVVMGVHCFGSGIPSSVSTVYATDYERASEEAEAEIRAAEKAAGIGQQEEDGEPIQEEILEETQAPLLNDEPDDTTGKEGEQVSYEDKTISSQMTLTEDLEVGNLVVNGALHLNGHRILVHGDVVLNDKLCMEDGYLKAEGSLIVNYGGGLSMDSSNDYIEVSGDYIYNGSYEYSWMIKNGTIAIGGNLYGSNGTDYCKTSFIFDTACKVIMNGDHAQSVDIRTDSEFKICNLIIENTSEEGVLSHYILNGVNITDKDRKLHYKAEGEFGETLTEDKIVEGNYCLLGDTLDLAGHNLTVHGDFLHAGGQILINGGSLTIEGDYKKQYCYMENGEEHTNYSTGRLIMQNEQDYVWIGGDYIDSGWITTEGDLTAGVLELKGSMLADDSLRHPLFYAKEAHLVRLTGEGKQVIRNGAAYSGDYIQFANLTVDQAESGSLVMESMVAVTGSVAHLSGNITGMTRLLRDSIISTDLYGDIKIEDTYSFSSDITIHGNLHAGYGYKQRRNLYFQNCHVTVTQNLYHMNVTPVFTGEQAMLTVLGDYILQSRSYNTVNTGILQIGGDLKKEGDASISFEKDAEVHFIGDSLQSVSVSHAQTLLTNVVVDNPAGVVVEDNIGVVNVSCKQGVLSYASGGIHGFTMEEDGEYEGDLIIGGGVLDLNGHNYRIKGNLTIANGALNMTNEADHLIVEGDFTTASTMDHSGKLTDGVLELKGDFAQAGGERAFISTDRHTVLFNGSRQQEVSFANPNVSYFCNLEVPNLEGISLSTDAKVTGVVKQTGRIKGYLCISSTTTFAENSYQGDIKIAEKVKLSGNLKIDGNLLSNAILDLNGKELDVTGRAVAAYYDEIDINHGHLICGSLDMQNSNGIYMRYEDDRITVRNDFIIYARYDWFGRGKITVGGDVTFAYSNVMEETLLLELNGDRRQTITMSGNGSCFGTLLLNNSSEEGIYIADELVYKKLENTAGTKVTFSDGGVLGYALNQDEIIEGDFLLSGGDMDLNGHSLTVKGDFIQKGGSLNIDHGNLLIGGDYCLAEKIENEDAAVTYENTAGKLYMSNADDCITVKGDMHIAVSDVYNCSCLAGTVNLSGNLTVWNGSFTDFGKDMILILNGGKQQQLAFGNGFVQLGGLSIENAKGAAVSSGKIYIKGELSTNGYPVEGWIELYNGASIKDSHIKGNVCFADNYYMDKDLYVEGDVNLCRLKLNGYHLTVDGSCTLNNDNRGTISQTSGILEIKGDVLFNGSDCSYQSSGTNQVILSGDKKQIIQNNYLSWEFQELIIRNTSEEGVYAAGLFDARKIIDPDHKLSFYTEGNAGYTLTKDTVIQGDFNLLTGTMDLNGYQLTVTGNLLQRGGIMDVNSGRLEVYGNYTLGNPRASGGYDNSHAQIYLDHEEDYVYCGGDITLAAGINFNGHLKQGTIELKGNFNHQYQGYSVVMPEGLTIRFMGEEKQEIINTGHSTAIRFGTIFLENTSAEGVVITNDLEIRNPIKGNGKLLGTEGKTVYWNSKDGFPFAQWKGNLALQTSVVLAKDLTVDGTLILNNSLDLKGKHLMAETLDVNSGLTINGGILQTKKDLILDNSRGRLNMQQDADLVQITGNLTATSGAMSLSAGSMEVKGNVNLNGVSLTTEQNHSLVLSGKMTARGTAYIQTVTIPESITLNRIVLTKPRNYYVFNRAVEEMCTELIEDIQDITAPSVPGGLSAENVSYTGLKLTWNASADDTGVAGYDVYRDDKKVMSVSGTSYTDRNLVPGTKYNYYVVAKDEALNTSGASETYTVTTLEDNEAPEIPVKPELSERMATALKLTWNAAKDNVKTTGYRIFRDGEEIADTSKTEYFDSGLLINHRYTYTILAYDGAGNASEVSEEAEFYTQAVEIESMSPANYAKLSGIRQELSVRFINAGSTSGYQVYMGYREPGEEDYTELIRKTAGSKTAYRKQITAYAYLETAKVKGEEVEVLVRITDAGGYETEETYTYYLDKSAPAKLTEAGVEIKDGVAVISYAKGTDADLAGYYIYREEDGKAREQIADIKNPARTYYYDKKIKAGVTYTYYAAAYDEEGLVGELSDALVAACDEDHSKPVIEGVEPAEGILYGTAALTICARDNKALDKVLIEMYQTETEDYRRLTECPFTADSILYELDTTGWKDEVTLRFTVYDEAGNENEDEFIKTYTIDNEGPGQIQNLQANIISTTAILTWNAPEEEDFSHFSLEEQQADGTWREIARTTEITGYALEGLLPDSTHVYRVTGYDIRNNAGTPSESITVAIKEDTIVPRITSIAPNGGYYNDKIPLVIKGYDNIALSEMVIEYSADKENWTLLTQTVFEEHKKEQRVSYDFDLSEIEEEDIYVRAYCQDTAGNAGDKEQVLLQCRVDKTAPQAVDKLTAEGEGGSIHLSWNEPVDNDVAGYRIYRSPEGLNSYTCIAKNVTTLGYYDRTAVYDAVYSYRITAFDMAGNESEYSNVAVAQKLPDDEAPVIHSVIPEEDKWISGITEISVLLSDNDRVTYVEFALKGQEENSTKHIAGIINTDINGGTVSYNLDTTDYENGVYELLVTAKDAAGNISRTYQSVCHISNVTLTAPVLYANAGNWCTNLHYSGTEDTGYILYKKKLSDESFETAATGTGSLMYKDNEVNPNYTYVYQLVVQDKAGNTAKSVLSYVKPNQVDDQKPKAVILANTAVVEGYETVFNGLDSTDNHKIASYTWDFGDGSKAVSGPTPRHTYDKEGEYNVTLTVTDPAGNTNDTTIKMTVLPKDKSGKAVIEVRNASGTPLKGVTVFVNSSSEHNDTSYTDGYGKADVMQRPGTYRVALYKPGYVATEVFVEIELHGEREYSFVLDQGETVTADFTVRQMTFEEMVEAGIDLNAPENQHVFTVQTELLFMNETRPIEKEKLIMLPAGMAVDGNSGGGSIAGGGNGGGGSGGGPLQCPEDEETEFENILYFMRISQTISWLKDMYEATLIIYNNATSQTIVARDLEAKLLLQEGISLAGTYSGQLLTKKIKDIRGGESDFTTWYLRGDTPGRYRIHAMLTGKLQPFDADLACSFESNEFDVTAGQGLSLMIQPEDRAEKEERYYIYFTLSNEGDKEFYNVKTTFGTKHQNSKRFVVSPDGSKKTPVMSAGDGLLVECLKPGESISGLYKTFVPVEGKKWENYKRLVDSEYKVLSGANTGVSVKISPVASHVPVPGQTYQPETDYNFEADPVNVSTGAYMDEINALSVQGVNPVTANLQYDSAAVSEIGEFGYGWTHNYEARIVDAKDGTVRYYVSPTGYYTFLAEDYEMAEYAPDGDGYFFLDISGIPEKQNFKCLNENKAEYVLKRDDKGAFTLTDAAGTTTKFDERGNLTSIRNKDGKEITITRSKGQFTVKDAVSGRKLIYTLNEDKLVEKVEDGTGKEVLFYYDENRCLKQFTNAMGENTYYTYDEGHRILTVTDDDNNTYVTNTYKTYRSIHTVSGRVVRVESQKDGLGNMTTFDYKEDERSGDLITTVVTRSGKTKKTVTDAYGNVTCQTNEAGDETLMTYDEDGNQTSVNNANDYNTVYRYDSNGNMTAIENSLMDGSQAETVMTYDDEGNMRSMKNASGESMCCTYYDNGLIKSVTDQNGNTVEYRYNINGQVVEEKDSNGKTVVYGYNAKGDLIHVKDKNGNITEYVYNKTGQVEETAVKDVLSGETYTTHTFYDDLGRVDYSIDTEGGVTAYEYDCAGNVTSRTDPGGAMTVYQYDGNYQMVKETVYTGEDKKTVSSSTAYAYTKEGLLKKVTDAESGTVIENTYDAAGNKTREVEKDKNGKKLSEALYEYDKAGNVVKQTQMNISPKEGEPESLCAQWKYYPNGKLNYMIDMSGVQTTYSYDKNWRVQTVVSDTEPAIVYTYDAAGRMLTETVGGGSDERMTTGYTYDIYGNVTETTDPIGNKTLYRYDGNGNLLETEDCTGRVFYSKYDALNRVVETGMRDPEKDRNIPLTRTAYSIKTHTVTETDAVNGGTLTTAYDSAGRPVRTTNGEGDVLSETIYDTEGRILQTVDAKGMLTEHVYNSFGQIEKVRTGEKGSASAGGLYTFTGEVRETVCAYDALGRNTQVTDAEGGVSSVVFDGLGRISSIKDPNQNQKTGKASRNTYTYTYNKQGLLETEKNAIGNTIEYQYNSELLLKQMTDSAGEKTAYTYDSLNRLKTVKDDLGTIEYTYDANGNITEVSEKEGGLSNLFTGKKVIRREFDALNRVTKYTDYKGREVKYAYDALGNMTALTYPGGEIVRYEYNDDGSVSKMTSNSGGTFTYGYDSYGRLCKITRADGSTETREYDAAGQLVSQIDKDKAGNLLQENRYIYNVFGEVVKKDTASNGDLSALTTVNMTYDDANRLKTYNGENVTYDEKGNMTYGPVDGVMQELTYDCRNRLVEAGGVSYTYDAENTRIATTENGLTTEYVTDTGGSLSRLLVAYEADNTETTYYYGAEGLAAQYNSGTKKYFAYHYDNIGSTTLLTDIAGAVAERIAYGTYGELLTTVKNAVRFLYNGSYGVATDSNGLYYMRARYYNPDIKRFINQDIKVGDIGSSQSLNRYAYCEGNPVSMVDPFGLCGENANDQSPKSKFGWLHTALDVAGLVFDVADAVNAAVYAMEGDWTNAAICVACAIPAVGAAVIGVAKTAKAVIKAKKAEKIASLAAEASRMTKNAANTLDTLSDTMKAVSKWGDNPLKLADGITAEAGSRAMKALEAGGDFAKESQKAVWEMKAVVGADGIRLSTKADEGASLLKHGFAGTDGVAKSAGKGSSKTTRVRHYTNSKGIKGIQEKGKIIAKDNNRVYLEMANRKPLSSKEAETFYELGRGKGRNYVEFDVDDSLLEWLENPRYHRMELTVKGDVEIKNAKFFKRKK